MNNKVSQLSKSPTNNIIWLSTCHSTNSYAKEWIRKNEFAEGWTVSTYKQTNGRGQMGNSWESEPNQNLTFSTVYSFPDLILSNLFFLNIAVSIGMVEYLNKINFNAEIKWPNDIYINSKKVAGILIEPHILEGKINNVIIGIGLNLNQKHFLNSNAISLYNISDCIYKIEDELENILMFVKKRIEELKRGEFDSLKSDYYKKLYLLGKPTVFKSQGIFFMGIIKGVDETGMLIVETETNLQIFNVKEIEFMK